MMKHPWPEVPLSEVLTERQEVPDEQDVLTGNIRIVGKIGFNEGKIQLREETATKTKMILVCPGDLVVSGINAAKGAIAIYDPDNQSPVAATIHYGAYIPTKSKVDIKYLWWLLRSRVFKERLEQFVPGGIKTELKASRFLPVPIPLPPLPEQQRIVAKVEEVIAKIHEARTLRQQVAKEAEALPRRTADELLDNKLAPRKPLVELLSEPLMNGLSVPASRLGSGICFAKVGVVNRGVFNANEMKLVDLQLASDSPYWLRKGDIVVSRGNSPEFVGRAAVYEGNPPKCAMPDLLIRIRLDPKKSDVHFVSAFFYSTEAREYIAAQISGTSSTMPKISQSKLEALPVPVPPLLEQRRIVAELDTLQAEVDALKHLQAETAAELDALPPSILDKAFKGEL